jgi:hypothetical protein
VKLSPRLFGLCRIFAQIFWNMKTRMKTLKALALILGLSMLTATQMNAQNGGGVFARGGNTDNADNVSMMNRDGAGIENGVSLGGATTENPTEAPLGSGIAFLVAAGFGYTLFKKKEDKQ